MIGGGTGWVPSSNVIAKLCGGIIGGGTGCVPSSKVASACGGIIGGGTGWVPSSNVVIACGGRVGGTGGCVPSSKINANACGGIIGGGTGCVPSSNIASACGGMIGGGTGWVPSSITTLCGTATAVIPALGPVNPARVAHNNNPVSFPFIKGSFAWRWPRRAMAHGKEAAGNRAFPARTAWKAKQRASKSRFSLCNGDQPEPSVVSRQASRAASFRGIWS